MSYRKTLVFGRCMGFVTVMCGLLSMTSAVIGPFHPGFDHGQPWAQAPRGHLPSDFCDRRKENNSQGSRLLVPAVSFPASGTTEQKKVSFCETTHHWPGGLWQVQVRSCVSINISSCFSPESGYKSRFLPLQKCSLGPQRFLVLLLLIAQIGFDLIIFSSDIQEGQDLLTARLITSTEGRSCDLSFAHGLRFFHTSPKPVLCCPIWPFPSEAVRKPICLDPLTSCRRTLVPKDRHLDEWFGF